jgi:Tfp pilus assembly protein PilX
MRSMRQRIRDEGGIALVMAIGFLAVLSITGATLMHYSSSNTREASRSSESTSAFHLAEAGMSLARSVLWNASDPSNPSAVGTGSSSLNGGTASYSGTFDSASSTWTLTGTGTVPNPTGGAALTRTISSQVEVAAGESAWDYLFADATQCIEFENNLTVDAPVYIDGDACLKNSAILSGTKVQVRGTVQVLNTASIGTAASPVPEVHVAGGCRQGSSGSFFLPCTSAHRVWATSFSSSPTILTKPVADFSGWYANAKPGPLQNCSSGSFPGGFDNDGSLNRSLGTAYLTPASAYDCQVIVGGVTVGRIAWTPGSPGTLTIAGTIFFDGKIEIAGNTFVVYQGRASIYASDVITIQNFTRICGVAACDSTWDPATNLLVFVSGATADDGFILGNNTTFQGAIYAETDYIQQNSSVNWGPVVARNLKPENNSTNFFKSIGAPAPGQPTSPAAGATLVNVPESYVTD